MATFRQEYELFLKICKSKKYDRLIERAPHKKKTHNIINQICGISNKFDTSHQVDIWLMEQILEDLYGENGLNRDQCESCEAYCNSGYGYGESPDCQSDCALDDVEYLHKEVYKDKYIPLCEAAEKYASLTDSESLNNSLNSVIDNLMFYVDNGISPIRIRKLIKQGMNQRIIKPVQEA